MIQDRSNTNTLRLLRIAQHDGTINNMTSTDQFFKYTNSSTALTWRGQRIVTGTMLDVVPPLPMTLTPASDTYSPSGHNTFGNADEVRRALAFPPSIPSSFPVFSARIHLHFKQLCWHAHVRQGVCSAVTL